MKSHTLILATPKINIPETDTIQFIKDLIISNLVNVHYFGAALDNLIPYIDEEIAEKNKNTTFLTFHFKDDEIDYSNYNEDALLQLIYNKLASKKNIDEFIKTDKDIEIFIN